jgi:hypothetical protein
MDRENGKSKKKSRKISRKRQLDKPKYIWDQFT